jgi:NAD(P)-dependent dehydrogenase (short-subunit alcohol dehydrogenase family)
MTRPPHGLGAAGSAAKEIEEMPFPDVSGHSLDELISLAGRAALVTGGARGLGLGISRRLSEAGAAVAIADVDEVGAKEAAEQLKREFAANSISVRLDVTDGDSVASAAEAVVATFGAVDIWINNAGVYPSSPILETTDAVWDRVLDTNLRGTFLGCREAVKRMTGSGKGGVIVNMASIAGVGGRGPGVTHYVASKHGIVGMTKQLALEVAEHRIRALAVAPSIVITPGVEEAMSQRAAQAGVELEELLTGAMGRPARPDDVARVVLFCVSDLSMFMTGSTLLVDGGEMAR